MRNTNTHAYFVAYRAMPGDVWGNSGIQRNGPIRTLDDIRAIEQCISDDLYQQKQGRLHVIAVHYQLLDGPS